MDKCIVIARSIADGRIIPSVFVLLPHVHDRHPLILARLLEERGEVADGVGVEAMRARSVRGGASIGPRDGDVERHLYVVKDDVVARVMREIAPGRAAGAAPAIPIEDDIVAEREDRLRGLPDQRLAALGEFAVARRVVAQLRVESQHPLVQAEAHRMALLGQPSRMGRLARTVEAAEEVDGG